MRGFADIATLLETRPDLRLGAFVVEDRDAALKVYPGAPHGLAITHQDQLNEDLLAFLRS